MMIRRGGEGSQGVARSLAAWTAALVLAGGISCAEPVKEEISGPTTVSGEVSSAAGGPVAGVVLLEKGRLYGKGFRYGGLIDEEGRFSIALEEGGSYGIHVYATKHVYFPLGVEVEEGRDNHYTFSLPPNPAVAEAPVISKVVFEEQKDATVIRLTVEDPNGNLSHQVLGLNAATQEGLRLLPPKFVFPWTKTYPNGEYTLRYQSGAAPVDPKQWYFIAADNRCYTSNVMRHPFTASDFILAHSPSRRGGVGRRGEEPIDGEEIFRDTCTMCHYGDSRKTKVGPGLKGIFSRETSPVQGFPVTEDNIRTQIMNGGKDMPPYDFLSSDKVEALIAYLKTI